MRKNICILLCVLAASFTFAQIRTNGVPASTISNQSAFIDASSSLFTGSTNSGKGIAFPRTDLTIFTFNPSAGNAFGFPTGFDGFLVYNSATGTTPATGSGVGNQSVTPGYYYFSNPGSTGDISTGSWVAFADITASTNAAPEANSVSFSGTLELGELLTGSYSYSDADSDPEETSTFQWYRADDASGTNQTAISGATASTYTLQAADENKFIAFEVTPAASSGVSPGSPVLSSYQGPVVNVPTVTTTTGEIWMDRNLGATQVATSKTDTQAYGDLYQWGRLADGHEDRNSNTTATTSAGDVPGHGDFITNAGNWRTTNNNNLWQGVNGINNPCPTGFRLPTSTELDNERLTWSSNDNDGAFASPLKLTVAGTRKDFDGTFIYVGTIGFYWSSTSSTTGGSTHAWMLSILTNDAQLNDNIHGDRGDGNSVRCIKD